MGMRYFAVGDIHGAHIALQQCLDRSGFNKEEDCLVVLGDVADGWTHVKDTVDILLTIKHRIDIRGNHDQWFIDFLKTSVRPREWVTQGGQATLQSYAIGLVLDGDVPVQHRRFFDGMVPYWELRTDSGNTYLFVHGGLPRDLHPAAFPTDAIMWDRGMVQAAQHFGPEFKRGEWDMIFVGHTSTQYLTPDASTLPQTWGNVTVLDTGAGWDGKLTLMNVETGEYWQSDEVKPMYPEEKGRFG